MATKTVTLTINGTEPRPMPADSEGNFAGFRFRLTTPAGAHADSEITQDTVWTFGGAAPGVYTASVVALDDGGEPLGEAITVEVVVGDAPPLRTYLQPLGLSYVVE